MLGSGCFLTDKKHKHEENPNYILLLYFDYKL